MAACRVEKWPGSKTRQQSRLAPTRTRVVDAIALPVAQAIKVAWRPGLASDDTKPHKRTPAPPSERETRAAAALRQNLRKRKDQQRRREAASDAAAPALGLAPRAGSPRDDPAG